MDKNIKFYSMDSSKITVQFGDLNSKPHENLLFENNKVVTTKYTVVTWFPKSFLMQFNRMTNIYFLFISILTFLTFSPERPGSSIGTFALILLITMIKEAIQDYSHYKYNLKVNDRIVKKYSSKKSEEKISASLMPGDIVKILNDDEI